MQDNRFLYRSVLSIFVILLLTACSPSRFIVDSVANSMGSASDIYMTENDPLLVREAFPFNLKTIELLLQKSPDNTNLLVAAASGFTMYSYAFVLEDGERMATENIRASRPFYQRANKLFLRGYDYGMRALESRHEGFSQIFVSDPGQALALVDEEDIPAMYWTAAALAGAISASQGDPSVLINLPKVGYLFERAMEIDSGWGDGAILSAMMKYETSRPDASADSDSLAHSYYLQALEISDGNDCSLYVGYAETFSVPRQDRDEFIKMLNMALAVDTDAEPDRRLSNMLAQDRARWLLGRVDDLFY